MYVFIKVAAYVILFSIVVLFAIFTDMIETSAKERTRVEKIKNQ